MAAPTDPPGAGETNPTAAVEPQPASTETAAALEPAAAPAAVEAPPAPERIRLFSFRQPSFLSPAGLRRLRLRHEEFARSLSARLSIYLRLEFGVQLAKLQTINYRQFTAALPKPAYITLFKAEPLRGIGLIEIPRALGMGIVDRLLGGPLASVVNEHEFSEIEVALLDQVMDVILAEWCNLWADLQMLTPTLLGHEDDGQFLKTAPHDTVMLVLAMEAKVGDRSGQIQFAIPCHALEPFIRRLAPVSEPAPAVPRFEVSSLRWNRGFDDVPVPVTALWNDLQLTGRQIANLKPGDILPLDTDCLRRVKLCLAEVGKFEGNLGTANGKWAVAVTTIARPSLEN